MGRVRHPYAEKLEQMIAMAFPEYAIETIRDGKPGDLVSSARGDFGERITSICECTSFSSWLRLIQDCGPR
jgi:hypothetical protein